MSDYSAEIAAVVLAAGLGTRMKSDRPKVMHEIANRPLVGHVRAALSAIPLAREVVVIGPDQQAIADAVTPVQTAVQHDRLGTADAVKAARERLAGFDAGTILVLFGDTPFIRTETLTSMIRAREAGAGVVVLGFRADDPTGYGRLVTDGAGALSAIVEHKDASEAERAINLCNSGVMAIDASILFPLVDRIGNDNAKGEYYLTDIVALARGEGLDVQVIEASEEELLGINSRVELADAEKLWQQTRRRTVMEDGATLLDPETVWFSADTVVGRDVTIAQNVVFGPGVTVEDGAEIRSFCHLEGCRVASGAQVGPYARLRPGADIGAKARVGNFVEVKNATLEGGAKANHLAYIGDAHVGADANIGAGTITCNYDGFLKSRTIIGAGAFIGSNSALVAPVEVGEGAIVGAGSTVTKNVEPDAIAVARGRQTTLPGAARKFRDKRRREKEAAVKGDEFKDK